jgi:hypothetical protein
MWGHQDQWSTLVLTGSFMKNPTLIRASLSDVRVIMVIMHVLVVDLLCQAVMGWILVIMCILPGACGRLRLRLVLPAIKWPRYLRIPALGPLTRYLGYPFTWTLGDRVHAQPWCEGKLDWVDKWWNPAHPQLFEMGKKDWCRSLLV